MQSSRKRGGAKGLNVYSNLATRRKQGKDARARRHAEYLATLPKHPVARTLYRLHPKRFFAYWFSRDGLYTAGKIAGIGTLILLVLFGALFMYYRRELDAIRPDEIAKRVQTTVTTYTDRNGVVLWEDKGDGNYKLVVKSEDISPQMKEATVAIEDKDFYKHGGISFTGMIRAIFNNFSGGDTQGGSTLTQQLVKQVFFADEAQNRGLGGVPRKIKETILAIEVERMYNKDQILTLYLNESPYGGRRNGVESAAQTYFGKSAKALTLPESALLASIPQQPGNYDPYRAIQDKDLEKSLLDRQHTTLDHMAQLGYITQKDADAAKTVGVLDSLLPETDQFKGIKAPHFVQMVKGQLEAELGKAIIGNGGLTVKTTLDWRAQQVVDSAMDDLFNSRLPAQAGFDNSAMTLVDVPTGQVLALRGSRGYDYGEYGAVNVATSYLQPGSSVKPLVYSALFRQKQGENYGAGSILSDSPLPASLYATDEGSAVQNFNNSYRGNISIRSALAESRNIPAIKAYILNDKVNGNGDTIATIKALGDKSYCTQGTDVQVGASAAIGTCGLKQVEHVEAFATLARGGVYKAPATVLEVKNAEGQSIKKWQDQGKQVIDPQIPYIISDILSDDNARIPTFGPRSVGMYIPGVKTATKTGTTNVGDKAKDIWMMSYSPKLALGIWAGNHVPQPLKTISSSSLGTVVAKVMKPLHENVYAKDGTWKAGDWFTQPTGVQKASAGGPTDLFPSWYSKVKTTAGDKFTFDKISKKKATECTPDSTKIEVTIGKITDPLTGKTAYISNSDGYNPDATDDVHKCDDTPPSLSIGDPVRSGSTYRVSATPAAGSHPIQSVEFKIGDESTQAATSAPFSVEFTPTFATEQTLLVTVTATDQAGYTTTQTRSFKFKGTSN